MKSRISELMDGELGEREAVTPLDALKGEGEARDAWRTYHLIRDHMRDTRMLSEGFAARVAAKIAAEPTVMAPGRAAAAPAQPRWRTLSAMAAGIAAVAFVAGLSFTLQDGAAPGVQLAKQQPVPPAQETAQVAPPDAANDYLYAHQGYSPRNSLQGVAPYVRMVSSEAGARKQ